MCLLIHTCSFCDRLRVSHVVIFFKSSWHRYIMTHKTLILTDIAAAWALKLTNWGLVVHLVIFCWFQKRKKYEWENKNAIRRFNRLDSLKLFPQIDMNEIFKSNQKSFLFEILFRTCYTWEWILSITSKPCFSTKWVMYWAIGPIMGHSSCSVMKYRWKTTLSWKSTRYATWTKLVAVWGCFCCSMNRSDILSILKVLS